VASNLQAETSSGEIEANVKGQINEFLSQDYGNWFPECLVEGMHVVLNTTKTKSKARFQFDTKTKDIVTTHISRSIRSAINETRTIGGVDTKPFGWVN
jgi:hypothetical protein